jgi:hypothetical protein
MDQAVIDTSEPATYHINYVATDAAGNAATSTRTVMIESPSITATSQRKRLYLWKPNLQHPRPETKLPTPLPRLNSARRGGQTAGEHCGEVSYVVPRSVDIDLK